LVWVWRINYFINKITASIRDGYFNNRKESKMVQWIKDRIAERTSWDGGALITVGVIGLFFSAIIPMNLICWAAIAWGVITILKAE